MALVSSRSFNCIRERKSSGPTLVTRERADYFLAVRRLITRNRICYMFPQASYLACPLRSLPLNVPKREFCRTHRSQSLTSLFARFDNGKVRVGSAFTPALLPYVCLGVASCFCRSASSSRTQSQLHLSAPLFLPISPWDSRFCV